jgi:3-phosphoshikimate 1-carboxyvinyltransferase
MGLLIEGVEVDDIAATTKTMNNFPALWQEMLTGANN